MDGVLVQILTASYFVAMLTAVAKAWRYFAEYRLNRQRFRLLGVLANLVLAVAMALIVVASGPNPAWPPDVLRLAIRGAIILWAILGASFEVCYAPTYLRFQPSRKPKEERDDVE